MGTGHKTVNPKSDYELFEELRHAGDLERSVALMELYRRHGHGIYTYSRKILNDSETAEDVTQEVFTKIYVAAQSLGEILNVPSYIFGIARNRCLSHKSRYARRFVTLEEFQVPTIDAARYEDKEMAKLLSTALELLPDEFREVIVLREYNNYSYDKIAELLGISIELVKVRIFRAKKKLRDYIEPYLRINISNEE